MEKTYQFALKNVSCATCVKHINDALKTLPNITKADINFASRTLTITTSQTPKQIIKTIEAAGYSAILLEKTTIQKRKLEAKSDFYKI